MKTYSKPIMTRGLVYCHHCDMPIPKGMLRYAYGRKSFCNICSSEIDKLIIKISEW